MSTGMLSIDLKAAFDSVWHDGLTYKLGQLGFPLYLTKLMTSYLDGRGFRTRVGHSMSRRFEVNAGVPQGAVLSPTLFNLFVHDMPQPRDVQLALFADDTAILATSKITRTVVNRLQRAANRMTKFFNRWRIQVNASKSQATIFTRKRARRHTPRSKISMCGVEVEWTPVTKYLGLHLDGTLTYSEHLSRAVEKSEKTIKSLYPLICRGSKLSLKNKILLFKSILRPGFSYGCPIWSCCATTHMKKMQRHQNKILKMMLNVPTRTPTVEVHDVTQLLTISDYVKKLDESFVARGLLNTNDDIVQLFC